ncbi:MAG: TadE/TadG family type IV pilus assembly protein [Pseudomonadota bacterium]
MFLPNLRRWAVTFLREEEASLTIELVLWLPVLLVSFQFLADVSIAMMAQQDFHLVARDASRMVALGQRTPAQAEDYIRERLADYDGAKASVSIADNLVTSTLVVPAESVTSISGKLVGNDISADVTMWVERQGSGS